MTMHGLSWHRFLPVLIVSLVALAAPAHAKPAKAKTLDLTDTVLSNRILTKFALIVRNSDLASFLSSRGPFTLFAPTDSAFAKIPPDQFQALLLPQNKDTLQRILLFHLVNGNRFSAKDLLKQKTLPSCEGTALTLRISKSGAQFVQKAKILHADMRCENGVIHEIDMVLIPPGLVLPKPGDVPPPASTDSSATNAAPAPSANAPISNGDTSSAPTTTDATTNIPATNSASP